MDNMKLKMAPEKVMALMATGSRKYEDKSFIMRNEQIRIKKK